VREDGLHVLGAVCDHPAWVRGRHPLAWAVVADQPQAVGVGVTYGAGEQVPGSPVMHDDGEPRCQSRVLDGDLAAGDPDELWWRAHSQTLPTTGLSRVPGGLPPVVAGLGGALVAPAPGGAAALPAVVSTTAPVVIGVAIITAAEHSAGERTRAELGRLRSDRQRRSSASHAGPPGRTTRSGDYGWRMRSSPRCSSSRASAAP